MRMFRTIVLATMTAGLLTLGSLPSLAEDKVNKSEPAEIALGDFEKSQAVALIATRAAAEDDPYGFLVAGRLAAELDATKISVGPDDKKVVMSASDMLNQAKTLAGASSPVTAEADKVLAEIKQAGGEQWACYRQWYCNAYGYCGYQDYCY